MRLAVQPLTCPGCRAELAFEDVSEATRTARCGVCRRVIDLTGGARVAAPLERPRPAPGPLVRPRAARPAEIQVEEHPHTLRIDAPEGRRFRWRTHGVIAAIAILGLGIAGLDGGYGIWRWGHWVVPLTLAGLSAIAGAMLFAGTLNRLRVTVDRGTLTVGGWPLPMGRTRWEKGELKQLFVEERLTARGNAPEARRSWTLAAVVSSGERIELVSHVETLEQALWLEQSLERALGILDVPVAGEAAPRIPAGAPVDGA
jgi:hypothetical protein